MEQVVDLATRKSGAIAVALIWDRNEEVLRVIVRDRRTMRDQVKEFKGGALMDERQKVDFDVPYHRDDGDVELLKYSYPASFFPSGVTEMQIVEHLA